MGWRCRPRLRRTDKLRPTDLAGVFFVRGTASLAAGATVGALSAFGNWPWHAGAGLLAVSVQRAAAPTWIAVGVLLSGLALYAAGLVAMRRRPLRSAAWAFDRQRGECPYAYQRLYDALPDAAWRKRPRALPNG